MVSTILVLFLFISYAHAISQTSDFQTISTSGSKALNHSNVQQKHQGFPGRLWCGSMREKNRLGEQVEERKNEISDALRKAHGSGGRGSPSGGSGTANINRHPNRGRNSATSSLRVPCFWASNLTLSVARFAFIFVFLLNQL